MLTMGRLSLVSVPALLLAGCGGGEGYQARIDSLRQAVMDHAGMVQDGPDLQRVRMETGQYAHTARATMKEMMASAASCPMMDQRGMQMMMGRMEAEVADHQAMMLRLDGLERMSAEARRHAEVMGKEIDGVEAAYRACNCDHM